MATTLIHNVETDEITERNLTTKELADLQSALENDAVLIAEKDAKKAALLAKLGITEEEAKLLLS